MYLLAIIIKMQTLHIEEEIIWISDQFVIIKANDVYHKESKLKHEAISD